MDLCPCEVEVPLSKTIGNEVAGRFTDVLFDLIQEIPAWSILKAIKNVNKARLAGSQFLP